jgi:hypothetical protein
MNEKYGFRPSLFHFAVLMLGPKIRVARRAQVVSLLINTAFRDAQKIAHFKMIVSRGPALAVLILLRKIEPTPIGEKSKNSS